MTEGIPGIIVIAVLLMGVMGAILMNSMDRPVRREKALDPDEPEKPGLELSEEDVVRDIGHPSALVPFGWGLTVLGVIGALYAWAFMDITPAEYSDTVNIDAVSQRAMLHTAALVTVAIGAVLACAGHVINEIRRGR